MFIILTGVAGAGKTTIGTSLARELGWRFYEGDDFHPAANIEKMRRGEALTLIEQALEREENGILACSALKRSYRARLRVDERVIFVHLALSQALIERRLKQRQDHFMNPALAESQFETLEPPQSGLTLNASLPPAVLVEQVRKALGL
jgi:carbohydrate kinase (thermoresistant glucokinase family)